MVQTHGFDDRVNPRCTYTCIYIPVISLISHNYVHTYTCHLKHKLQLHYYQYTYISVFCILRYLHAYMQFCHTNCICMICSENYAHLNKSSLGQDQVLTFEHICIHHAPKNYFQLPYILLKMLSIHYRWQQPVFFLLNVQRQSYTVFSVGTN